MSTVMLLAEYMAGWGLTHPGPVLAGIGVLGTGGTLGIAWALMGRDDMPLSRDEQMTVELFAGMPREVPPEVHHEPHVPRHARPEPKPLAPTAVLPRPPRPQHQPVLAGPAVPALAVLGAVTAALADLRDRERWPHLQRQWAEDTGTLTAICQEGS